MLTYDVCQDGASKENGEEDQDPGEVRRLEREQAKEVVPDKRVPATPDVHYHGCEGFSREVHLDNQRCC